MINIWRATIAFLSLPTQLNWIEIQTVRWQQYHDIHPFVHPSSATYCFPLVYLAKNRRKKERKKEKELVPIIRAQTDRRAHCTFTLPTFFHCRHHCLAETPPRPRHSILFFPHSSFFFHECRLNYTEEINGSDPITFTPLAMSPLSWRFFNSAPLTTWSWAEENKRALYQCNQGKDEGKEGRKTIPVISTIDWLV